MELTRAFFAVPLPDPLRREIGKLQTRLREAGADVKWVEPANLHITLRFLGEIERPQLTAAREAVHPVATAAVPFAFGLGGIGAFPSPRAPRVVWLGIAAGAADLAALHQKISLSLAPHGFAAEGERFQPHLTMGRVRSERHLERLTLALAAERGLTFPPGDPVRSFLLLQSVLTPRGPVYTPLEHYPLGREEQQ